MGTVKSREQKLVDICFSLVSTATDPQYQSHFNSLTQEQKMEWVAKHQFKKIGDPRPVWCEVLDSDLHMLEETRLTGAWQ